MEDRKNEIEEMANVMCGAHGEYCTKDGFPCEQGCRNGYMQAARRMYDAGYRRMNRKEYVEVVQSCGVCERITNANKDIFWAFARTHQPEDKDEFHHVSVRFCPACGREIDKGQKMEPWGEREQIG